MRRQLDLRLALGVAVAQVVLTTFVAGHQHTAHGSFGVGAIALLAAAGLALAARRIAPVATLAAALALTLAYELADYADGPVFIALIAAFVNAWLSGHRVAGGVSLVLGWAAFGFGVDLVHGRPLPSAGPLLAVAAWLGVIAAVSEVVRGRRAAQAVARERAAAAERARADEARRRRGEERLRIARELHDVLAHDISLINVQAGVALHLLDERPGQARDALAAIKHASKDALGELRSVLEALRTDEHAPRAPTAGLARLGDVVDGAAAAGLAIETEIEGEPAPLPAAVDLAALRIVQEALTNVIRHAGAARAAVRLRYERAALLVEVADGGRGAAADGAGQDGGGNGIAGMAERAASLGGTLEAGPRPGGGFRVRARLPLPEAGA